MPLPPELGLTEEDWNHTPPAVQAVVITLYHRVQTLQAQVGSLQAEVAALQAEVAQLREQLGAEFAELVPATVVGCAECPAPPQAVAVGAQAGWASGPPWAWAETDPRRASAGRD